MNRNRMFSSQMGSSKYEFDGDLDADIERKKLAAKERKQKIRTEIFKIYLEYGYEYADKELKELVVGLYGDRIIVTPEGFEEIERSQNGN